MQKAPSHSSSIRGQVLLMAVVLLSLCSTLMLGLLQVSLAVQEKIRLQLSADMAVLSALNCQANAMNSIAMANRAILANDALAGQLNALVSETTFYRRLVEKFKKLLRFIPYAGTISGLLSTGAQTVEKAMRKAASMTLPLARYLNTALRKGQETVRHLIPLYSLKAAASTLEENMPRAQLTVPSKALLLRQARSVQKNITELDLEAGNELRARTMDRRTLKRDWSIKVAGLSPAEKTGGTTIAPNELVARDKLRMKVFSRLRWRWKTVLFVKSRTSDFGYQTPEELLTVDTSRALSLPILVESQMPTPFAKSPFKGRMMRALSAGRLVYRRDSRPEEADNLFNPFWKAELMPVASETTARRIIPGIILKEVRH